MTIVYQCFEGRFGDNTRVLYERLRAARPQERHVWLADPAFRDGFPPDVETVEIYSPECVTVLDEADLLVANTHTDIEWTKRPGAVYLQTWHGTPLKRIHHDVLWAPAGRLDRLDRDIARWDILLSPNAASTPRLRQAFRFTGEVLEAGYPRNDVLLSPDSDAVRARVRAELGIADGVRVVLYTPTWRDDAVFDGDVTMLGLALQVEQLIAALGPGHCLLLRVHSMEATRHQSVEGADVRDVSDHPDVADLYLAADVMITDYSSTMFDFALTGKPLLFYVHDYEHFRDKVRGFYFDLAAEAPGPLLRDQAAVLRALQDLGTVERDYAERYAAFRRRYGSSEDGHATDRVLDRLAPVLRGEPA